MSIVNAYTVVPDEIKEGDVMLFVVKAMVMRRCSDGKLRYRLYRCRYDDNGEIPQGTRILNSDTVCAQLFPSLAAVGESE